MRNLFSLVRLVLVCAGLFSIHSSLSATIYEVGEGKKFITIGQVPWEFLKAGDTVLIHYRSIPYKEKWVICTQGTAAAPILVRGVPGPNGALPIIDGNGAITRMSLRYWGENRSLIKIGGATAPPDTMPRFITIEGLDIRNARPPYSFIDCKGNAQN